MDRDDAWVEQQGELEGRGGFQETHGVSSAVGGLVAGFEGATFVKTEDVHAEFFKIFREDELAGGVGTREGFAVAGEDVNRFFGEGCAEVFHGPFDHASCR